MGCCRSYKGILPLIFTSSPFPSSFCFFFHLYFKILIPPVGSPSLILIPDLNLDLILLSLPILSLSYHTFCPCSLSLSLSLSPNFLSLFYVSLSLFDTVGGGSYHHQTGTGWVRLWSDRVCRTSELGDERTHGERPEWDSECSKNATDFNAAQSGAGGRHWHGI